MNRISTFIFISLFFAINLFSQTNSNSQSGQKPEILTKLLTLVGKWEANATMEMNDSTYKFKYTVDFRQAADGNGIYMDESADIPGLGSYRAANLVGYDPYSKKLHWFSVDNMDVAHDHIGKLIGKDHFQLNHSSKRDGKTYKEILDLTWQSNTELMFKFVSMLNNKESARIEGTFVKQQ